MNDSFAELVRSNYFEKRDLELSDDDIVVVSCMRNEGQRLPYFLDYYRRLGVTRFLLVDNDSDDGTREYLAEQPDVEYFWTNGSYRGSSAGRLWLQELADTYATDRWVISVDVDELLVFPGSEAIGLRELCAYFDDNQHEGMFTVMLDMYSDRPLSQTRYVRGEDFLDACPYFETDTYTIAPGANPPFLSIFGGPRDRLFHADIATGRKPMMKKIPLVRWREGFSYIFSTHSHRFVQLSDVTGTLMHFKFFSTFQELAEVEAERGDRRQQMHYRTYKESLASDVCFYSSASLRYHGPADLVRLGMMCSTARFASYVASLRTSASAETDATEFLPEAIPAEGRMTLRSMAAVWPIINNVGIGEYFGALTTPPRDQRLALVREIARHIRVIDVQPDHLLVQLGEPALHRWKRSKIGMSVYVGRRLALDIGMDGLNDAFEVDTSALEPNICRLRVDIAGGATFERGGGRSVAVSVYLYDGEGENRPTCAPHSIAAVGPDDVLVYSQSWYPEGGNVAFAPSFRGVIDHFENGRIRGWAYDVDRDSFDVPLCVYVNGRMTHYVWPSERREGLDVSSRTGSARGRGFLTDLPLGYFKGIGDESAEVEVMIAGRNLNLRRSPMNVPIDAKDATWDNDERRWVVPGAMSDSDEQSETTRDPDRPDEKPKASWWKARA
jgi:hypothetical protein